MAVEPEDVVLYTKGNDRETVHVEFKVDSSELDGIGIDKFLEQVGVQFIKGKIPYRAETRKA